MLQWMTPRLADSAHTVLVIAQHQKAAHARKASHAKLPAMVNGSGVVHRLTPAT
jgi:hypothetical protein